MMRIRGNREAILALHSEFLEDIDWRINVRGVSIGVVCVDIGSFVMKALTRMKEIEKAQKIVASDPEVLGGVPVCRPTIRMASATIRMANFDGVVFRVLGSDLTR